jgi:hypothetical protein
MQFILQIAFQIGCNSSREVVELATGLKPALRPGVPVIPDDGPPVT